LKESLSTIIRSPFNNKAGAFICFDSILFDFHCLERLRDDDDDGLFFSLIIGDIIV
jgi:hypothetical protein